MKKVCVVGAGPFGMLTTRHVSECKNTEVVVFEATSDVGGLWNYQEKNDADAKFEREKKNDTYYQLHGYFHGSMYPYLQANIPYFFMEFKDLSHADIIKDVPIFPNISQHKKYQETYADKFDIRKKVRFNTLVKSVRLYKNLSAEKQAEVTEKRKFVVTTVDSRGGKLESNQEVHSFDYVVVATGHNSKPYIPEIKGIDKFKGRVLTAKNFREPSADMFIDKKILVLGASYSATDLIVQLFTNPKVGPQNIKNITLVGRGVKGIQTCQDFEAFRNNGKLTVEEGEIDEILNENTIRLSDGSEHQVDTLALCTGYQFNFPFLDYETEKIVDFNPNAFRGKFIAPLYQRFISIREPDLFFISLLDYTPIAHYCGEAQVMLTRAIIEGKHRLPSQDEMYQIFLIDIDDLQSNHKKSLSSFFQLAPLTIDVKYLEQLRNILKDIYPSDSEKANEFFKNLMATYHKMLEIYDSGNLFCYKNYDFHLTFDRDVRNSTAFV